MTHDRINLFRKRSVCLFLFAFLLTELLTFTPKQALACSCYKGDVESTVDGTSACKTSCGDDKATETSSGICTCESGENVEMGCDGVCAAAGLSSMSATAAAEAYEKEGYISPTLQIPIPGVSFTAVIQKEGALNINWIGEYITGVYKFLIGFGTLIAIIFIMIGGLQYALAGGHGSTSNAVNRIRNAVTGLVLLMSVYLILWIVNPNLTFFKAISLTEVKERELDAATQGMEGAAYGSISRETCDKIVEQAKDKGKCKITQLFTSPVGNQPSCGNHHWFDYGANGNYKNIKNLDYSASWGTPIKAPFDGVVTYQKQTKKDNRCGNRIYLKGSGAAAGADITICHAKDFVNDAGEVLNGKTVKQGDVIGHVGGYCCQGETPPDGWSAAKYGWCKISGTRCTDPFKLENCGCQAVEQSGNTSGPHVHVTWNSGGDFLTCLDY